MQVLVAFDLFFSLYLLVRRILPLGLLCDNLLCLWAVALAFLLASSVTRLRVPPTCWVRESLSSTLEVVVLSTLSNVGLLTMLLSELLSRLLTRRMTGLLSELLSRQLPCSPIR